MKTKLLLLAVFSLLTPLSAVAASSPLHGIWQVDANTVKATRSHEFVLRDGMFACMNCVPSYSIPADGGFHAIPTGPVRDELAVLVIDTQQVQITERKNGRLVANSIHRIMDGGSRKMAEHQDHSGSSPVVSSIVYNRIGNKPDYAHAVSGIWQAADVEDVSNTGRLFTLAVNGKRLNMDNPQGHSFSAIMDGRKVRYEGSSLSDLVSVEQMAPHRIKVTRYHEGEVVGISTYHVLPNGHTMKVVHEYPVDNIRVSYTATRQQSMDPQERYGVSDFRPAEPLKDY